MHRKTFSLIMLIGLIASLLAGCTGLPGVGPTSPIEPQAVDRARVICSNVEGNCVEAWSGTDLRIYSDEGSTETFSVEGALGTVTMGGTTPELVLGDGGAENAQVSFDGAAQDYHIGLEDASDDFVLGLGTVLGTTSIIYMDENQDTGLGGASAGSKLDVTGNVMVDGAADEIQLLVQGNGTQTTNPFEVETSAASNLFTVSNAGNIAVAGTSDLVGNIADSGGDLTIDDALNVTGAVDLDTTLNVDGNISDAGTAVTFADNVIVDGQADAVQLIVQGNATQTSNTFVVETSAGTDLFWVTNSGDLEMNGTTPALTIGDAGAEDTQINFDGVAQDFHIGLEDASDDMILGLGTTLGTTGILYLDENQDAGLGGASAGSKLDVTGNVMIDGAADEIQLLVQGNATNTANVFEVETSAASNLFTVSNAGNVAVAGTSDLVGNIADSGGDLTIDDALNVTGAVDLDTTLNVDGNISDAGTAVTFADDVIVDGQADAVQLIVQGNATQTSHTFVVETSAGTDLFWVTNDGDVEMNGTTPALTIGDAGGEDTQINFDGAAQDFHVGLYDTGDDLIIGLGTALGTTGIMWFDENSDVGINGASAGNDLDVTGSVMVDGDTDEIQLLVQGNATNTANVFEVETSAASNLFTVSNAGNVAIAGTTDLVGNVADSGGDLTIDDAMNVTGAVDLDSTLNVDGNISDAGTAVTFADNVMVDGAADVVQLLVQANATNTANLFEIETSAASDLFWVTLDGDVEMNGTTPQLTIGDAGTEDTSVIFDGQAQDYHIGLEDASDDMILGLGATLGTTGIIYLDENQDIGLGAASAGSKLDVTGNIMIDGDTDEIQLLVQGNGTQTANVFEVETSAASNLFTVSNAGNVAVSGTSNLAGNVQDSGGTFTIDDDVMIDGQADAIQLLVQGNGTQTGNIFEVESSDTTNRFTVSDAGVLTFAEGAIASSLIVTDDIKDGEIVDADINASADITYSKLDNIGVLKFASVNVPYGAGAGGSSTLLSMESSSIYFIYSIAIETNTVWTTTAGDDEFLRVGDGNDPNGFLDAGHAQLDPTAASVGGGSVGWYGGFTAESGAYGIDDGAGPWVYENASAETIDLSWGATGDDLTGGESDVWITYMRVE